MHTSRTATMATSSNIITSRPLNADARTPQYVEHMARADTSPLIQFKPTEDDDELEQASVTSHTSIRLRTPYNPDHGHLQDHSGDTTVPHQSPSQDWHRLNDIQQDHTTPWQRKERLPAPLFHSSPLEEGRLREGDADDYRPLQDAPLISPEGRHMQHRMHELRGRMERLVRRQSLEADTRLPPIYTTYHAPTPKTEDVPNAFCPEPFKGTEAEDAAIWFTRFQMYVTLKSWTEQQAAKALPMLLTNSAATWFHSLPDEDKRSFQKLKQAFEQRYLPHPAMRWANLEAFNARKQLPTESVDAYVQVMQRKGNDLQKGPQELMETVISGFQDHIRHFVIEREPKTLNQALHLAKLAESIKKPTQGAVKSDIAVLSAQIDDISRSLSVAFTSLQAQNQASRPQQRPLQPSAVSAQTSTRRA